VAFKVFFERAVRVVSVARRSRLDARQQRVRDAAHRGDDDDGTLPAPRADDPRHARERTRVLDRRAAELHHGWLISH
jgi:hypothetical protein